MAYLRISFAVLTFVLALSANAAVSDEKVRMWIAAALLGTPAKTDLDAKKALEKRRTSSALLSKWRLLKECRDAGQSLDLDLASAEHYMFIRAFAAEKGERDIEELPALYGDVKNGLGPVAQLLKTSSQPVSPPDIAVVRWGELGVQSGLEDFKQEYGKGPKEKTGNYQRYRLALEGYYINYAQKVATPKCRVKI